MLSAGCRATQAEKERAADVAAASCLILTGEVSFGARRTESLPCAEPSLPSADLHAQVCRVGMGLWVILKSD